MRGGGGGDPTDGGPLSPARIALVAALVIAIAVAVIFMFTGSSTYRVSASS